jgi:Ketosteroid isomerase-related protein
MNGDRDGARDVVNRLFEATNAHDVESLTRCFAEDYVNETPLHPSRGFRGRDQVRTNWTAIFQGVPDIRAEIVRSAYDGNDAWVECEMAGLRRDGAPHLMRGIIVFQVENGLISSARFYLEPVDTEDLSVDEAVASAVGAPTSGRRS